MAFPPQLFCLRHQRDKIQPKYLKQHLYKLPSVSVYHFIYYLNVIYITTPLQTTFSLCISLYILFECNIYYNASPNYLQSLYITLYITIPFAGLFPPNENQFPLTEIQFLLTENQFLLTLIQFPLTEIQFPPTESQFPIIEIQFTHNENEIHSDVY